MSMGWTPGDYLSEYDQLPTMGAEVEAMLAAAESFPSPCDCGMPMEPGEPMCRECIRTCWPADHNPFLDAA